MRTLSIFALALINTVIFAQSRSGFVVGANTTFYSDNAVNDFTPKIGWQAGYLYLFETKTPLSIGVSGMFEKKHIYVKDKGGIALPYSDGEKQGYAVSVPVSMIYTINKFSLSTGYQFSYNYGNGDLRVYDFEHSLHIGTAYALKSFDIKLTYAFSLSKISYGAWGVYDGNEYTIVGPNFDTRVSYLSFSVIF